MGWRPETAKRQVSRLGKIKIGKKKESQSGVSYPAGVDYFIPSGNFVKIFHEALGEEPNRIKIVLPDNDINNFFDVSYRCYNSKRQLLCVGNPHTHRASRVTTGGTITEDVECPCRLLDSKSKEDKAKCSAVARFSFYISKISSVIGVWTLETKSSNSINQIMTALDIVAGQRKKLAGAELYLNVNMWTGRGGRKFPVISLIPCSDEGLALNLLQKEIVLDVADDDTEDDDKLGFFNKVDEPQKQIKHEEVKDNTPATTKEPVKESKLITDIKAFYGKLGWPDKNDKDFTNWTKDAGTLDEIIKNDDDFLGGILNALKMLADKKARDMSNFIKSLSVQDKNKIKEAKIVSGKKISFLEAKKIYEFLRKN